MGHYCSRPKATEATASEPYSSPAVSPQTQPTQEPGDLLALYDIAGQPLDGAHHALDQAIVIHTGGYMVLGVFYPRDAQKDTTPEAAVHRIISWFVADYGAELLIKTAPTLRILGSGSLPFSAPLAVWKIMISMDFWHRFRIPLSTVPHMAPAFFQYVPTP